MGLRCTALVSLGLMTAGARASECIADKSVCSDKWEPYCQQYSECGAEDMENNEPQLCAAGYSPNSLGTTDGTCRFECCPDGSGDIGVAFTWVEYAGDSCSGAPIRSEYRSSATGLASAPGAVDTSCVTVEDESGQPYGVSKEWCYMGPDGPRLMGTWYEDQNCDEDYEQGEYGWGEGYVADGATCIDMDGHSAVGHCYYISSESGSGMEPPEVGEMTYASMCRDYGNDCCASEPDGEEGICATGFKVSAQPQNYDTCPNYECLKCDEDEVCEYDDPSDQSALEAEGGSYDYCDDLRVNGTPTCAVA
jgi:hypothetical protein